MLHQDESNKREKSKAKGVDSEDDLRDEVEDAVQKVCNATGCSVSICRVVTDLAAVPDLFGTRKWFRGRQFFHRSRGPGGWWFWDDSSSLHLSCTLFLI